MLSDFGDKQVKPVLYFYFFPAYLTAKLYLLFDLLASEVEQELFGFLGIILLPIPIGLLLGWLIGRIIDSFIGFFKLQKKRERKSNNGNDGGKDM